MPNHATKPNQKRKMTESEWRDLGAKHGTILGRFAARITIPAIIALAIYHAWVM